MYPPSVGPRAGPTITPMPKMAMAVPYSDFGNSSYRMAWDVESRAPPPMPWMIRQTINSVSECEFPHRNDAMVKMAMELAKYRRRPKYADNHPVIGSTMTLATM